MTKTVPFNRHPKGAERGKKSRERGRGARRVAIWQRRNLLHSRLGGGREEEELGRGEKKRGHWA